MFSEQNRLQTCCFIGHRKISDAQALEPRLFQALETLVAGQGVTRFLFGSKSGFNTLCHQAVSAFRDSRPAIERIYVRAEFPQISDSYRGYLLQSYEDTLFPEEICGAGRAVYVERNRWMIDHSRFCVFYYDPAALPVTRASGTGLAYAYALHRGKTVINLR